MISKELLLLFPVSRIFACGHRKIESWSIRAERIFILMARISAASLVAASLLSPPLSQPCCILLGHVTFIEDETWVPGFSKLDKISISAIKKKNNPVIKVIYFIVAESEPRCPDSWRTWWSVVSFYYAKTKIIRWFLLQLK